MPPTSINAPLRPIEAEALLDYSRSQDRDPRRQAQRFIREGLERVGALPTESLAVARLPAPSR
jgi:hypothetical protein